MDSHKPHTYGKRAGTKRKQETCSPIPERPTTPTTNTGSTKRRKVSPRTTGPTRSPSPNPTEVHTVTEDEETQPLAISQPKFKPKSAPKATTTASMPQSPSNGTRAKLTQDLSGIFDAMLSPSSSSASPTKLAKRMLARSKTESSIDSHSTVSEKTNAFERTPSLPTLPPSPSKPRELFTRPSNPTGSLLPILPPTTKATTRTYAGKFRSFLETRPSSNSQILDAEEEFESRESYSSLRSRWDVDNSEDDPYPYLPSPSKSNSNSATPDRSPSRKGKLKAANSTARLAPIAYKMSNPLKSISELRNKGESRRFLDELGYLFEGMDGQGGLGLRRASALEITTKLCDDDFARKAKAADFFTRTWDLFLEAGSAKGEDKILDILLIFFVALVARDTASIIELTQRSPSPPPSPSGSSRQNKSSKEEQDTTLFSALFRILGSNPPSVDPLILIAPQSSASDMDLKKAGINKKDRQLLNTVYNTIAAKSDLFPDGTTITTPLLIAFSLQVLPSHSIPIKFFPIFLESLRLSLSSDASTSLTSSLSSQWLNATKAIPYRSTYYHLRLLDAYLLDQWDIQHDESSQGSSTGDEYAQHNDDEMNKAREKWLADDLGAFAVCIELFAKENDPDYFPARKYLDTTLRVLVTLTHTDKLWGLKVVRGYYALGCLMRTLFNAGRAMQSKASNVKKEEDEEGSVDGADVNVSSRENDSQALDTLCLALGLLTNLVQSVDEAKDIVRETRLDPSCPLKKRECGRKCVCTHRISGIQILVDLYSQQQVKVESSTAPLTEDSPEAHAEADASFLRGHLAVLFGLLMMDNPENETAVLAALPSPFSSSPSDAKKAKAAKRAKFARLVEQAKDFSAFYTALSDHIGGEKESKVAGDVVKFLEMKGEAVI